MRSLRTAAVALVVLVATATTAAPLASVAASASAHAAPSSDPVFHPGTSTRFWFSPNGDKSSDKARVNFHLYEKARVTATAPYVRWVIATHGVDSYDVADVTVRYSYLTPQP